MKRTYIVCLLSAILYFGAKGSSCGLPISGERLWDLAADALIIMESIESKLLQITLDFQGTFTVINDVASVINADESLALSINNNLDQLLISLDKTIDDVVTIESKVEQLSISTDVLLADMSSTFTALESFKATIGSKLDLVIQDLQAAESNIELLIQTEIDQQITISSHLNILQTDVDHLNSALDSLSIIESIHELGSSLGIIISVTDRIAINVNNLQNIIETDFSGTWTALQAQLELACTVESLVETIHLINETDFSGVFTSLALLQQTVNDIDSMIDLSSISTSEALACAVESKIAQALQIISFARAEVVQLPALGESIITLLASDVTLLDGTSSLLDITATLLSTINSSLYTITSKVELIEEEVLINSSNLEIIAADLAEINAEITSDIDNIITSESLLDVSDSLIELALLKAYTVESIIDLIVDQSISIHSKIDAFDLVSKSAVLESEIALIADEIEIINSKADLLVTEESIINGIFDVIINSGINSIELLLTIDSKIDAIASVVDVTSIVTLNSKLQVIDNQVAVISGKMVSVDSKLAAEILLSQDLVTDFQETWTILDAISNTLTSDQLNLQTISSKLGNVNLTLDLSSVYTAVNGIINQKYTLDTKVDIYSSLADALDSLVANDFGAVFTALNGITQGGQTVNAQLNHLNSDVDALNVNAYFGTPIYNRDVGTSGYVITQPGRYYLAEDIIFTPTTTLTAAISWSNVNDVTLDLNGYILQQSATNILGTYGINVSNSNNIRIQNGSLSNFFLQSTNFIQLSNVVNAILEDLNVLNGRGSVNGAIFIPISTGLVFRNCFMYNVPGNGLNLGNSAASRGSNASIKDSDFYKTNQAPGGFGSGVGGFDIHNVCVQNIISNEGNSHGILFFLNKNILISDSITSNCGTAGIRLLGEHPNSTGFSQNGDIRNCVASQCQKGIVIGSTNGSNFPFQGCTIMNNSVFNNQIGINLYREGNPVQTQNNFVAFNSAINNNTNIAETADSGTTGPNTILGNFAFNSTVVGNPNNKNYTVQNSNLTNKFLTINQTGVSKLPALAGEWYNINMLP